VKTCSKCQEELDESSFDKQSVNKDGLRSWCKDCEAEIKRKRYLAQRKAGGMPVKPRSVAIKDGLRQKMIVQYGIDLVEVLDTLE
jgi:NAD-dependent SIR2 family protein deacetylase